MRWGRQRWGISDSFTNKRRMTVTMDHGQQAEATVRGALPTLLSELLFISQKQYSEGDFMEFSIIRKYLVHVPGNRCGRHLDLLLSFQLKHPHVASDRPELPHSMAASEYPNVKAGQGSRRKCPSYHSGNHFALMLKP